MMQQGTEINLPAFGDMGHRLKRILDDARVLKLYDYMCREHAGGKMTGPSVVDMLVRSIDGFSEGQDSCLRPVLMDCIREYSEVLIDNPAAREEASKRHDTLNHPR